MFLRGALSAAIFAVPLASAVGQSASQHDPPARAASDSSGSHRLAWVVGAGTAGAAVFTTFVRLSERGASANAERGLTLPGSPVPNHYTDGTLPGSGVSPGQNAPPPGQTQPLNQNTSGNGDPQSQPSETVGDDPGPGPTVLEPPPPDDPGPPGGPTSSLPSDPTDDGPVNQQPPQYQPPADLGIVVTTPEPASIFLLGTGVIPLLPALRRRRRD